MSSDDNDVSTGRDDGGVTTSATDNATDHTAEVTSETSGGVSPSGGTELDASQFPETTNEFSDDVLFDACFSATGPAQNAESNIDLDALVLGSSVNGGKDTVEDLESSTGTAADKGLTDRELEIKAGDAYRDNLEAFQDKLDEPTILALTKKELGDSLSWHEQELIQNAHYSNYRTQLNILTDPDTGKALKNENGDWVTSSRRVKGCQAPDAIQTDQEGVHIREMKSYHNRNNLSRNITQQTEARRAAFGEDVDLTFVIQANDFTLDDAAKLNQTCEDLGVGIDWQY